MPRLLDKDGLNLGCKVLPETRDSLQSEARRQARRRGGKGAELRGSAYVVNSLICWFLKQDKADRAKIVDEGRALFDDLLARDEEEGAERPVVNEAPRKGVSLPGRPPAHRKAGGSDDRRSG